MSDQWVDVMFMQGDNYNEVADMGIDEMVAHMSQWDYGDDTDFAHTRDGEPWGPGRPALRGQPRRPRLRADGEPPRGLRLAQPPPAVPRKYGHEMAENAISSRMPLARSPLLSVLRAPIRGTLVRFACHVTHAEGCD